jgi:uncharacterized protein
MSQPLVHRVAQACRVHGMVTLRFNFRSVGKSRGAYSGIDEHKDVEAAASFLRRRLGPGVPIALVGYSFGSVMTGMAAADLEAVQALVLIAFVAAWEEMPEFALERLKAFEGPVLAVCGEKDELAPLELTESVLRGLKLDLKLIVVPGADHFFTGMHHALGEQVASFLQNALGSARAL